MRDEIINYSIDDNDGSYTFNFSLDDGNGNSINKNIDVLKDEASDLISAKEVALQKAADYKQEYLDKNDEVKLNIIGVVELPQSTKAKAVAVGELNEKI